MILEDFEVKCVSVYGVLFVIKNLISFVVIVIK